MANRHKVLVIVAVALGTFLGALDTTIVGTAMPTVVASLGGLSLYSWVFAAYMLTATISAPIFGKLSDIFGRKPLFIIAVVIFLIGSALCGGAQDMTQLIIFRGLQGVGGGALFALAATIVGAVFPPVQRPRIQGIMQVMWATASIIGPAAGGFIVDTLGWRWTFYVNLPIGVLPILLIIFALRESREPGDRFAQIDYTGAMLLTLGVGSLLLLTFQMGQRDASAALPTVLFAMGAAILLTAFFFVERRAAEPMVPLYLFRNRIFAVSNSGNFLTGLALFGTIGFIPLFVQGVLHGSPIAAGAALTPLSLGWPAGAIIAGQVVNRVGYRAVSVTGIILMTLGFYLLTWLDVASDPTEVGRNVFIIGVGMGLLSPTLLVAIQNNVNPSLIGAATSSAQFFQTIGGALGTTLMGALMANVMYTEIARGASAGTLGEVTGNPGIKLTDPQALMQADLRSQLPSEVIQLLQNGLSHALHDVFMLGLIILGVGVIVMCLIPNSTPAEDTARQEAVAP